MLFVVKVLNVA